MVKMIHIYRIVIVCSLVWIVSLPHTHAQNLATHECGIVQSLVDPHTQQLRSGVLQDTDGQPLIDEQLYPYDAIALAITNLQAVCCEEGVLPTRYCTSDLPKDYLDDSLRLYDHLIDIGMRRMDGIPEAMYDHPELLDEAARSRRERINTQGVSPDGTPPGYIQQKFAEIFEPSENDKIQPARTIAGTDAERVECGELRVYDSLKYRIAQQCDIAYCIMRDIYDNATLWGYTVQPHIIQTSYAQCHSLQQLRILGEYDTTSSIMQAQANTLSRRSQEQYLTEYLTASRMGTLAEKLTRMLALMEIVNTKYTEGTKTCN